MFGFLAGIWAWLSNQAQQAWSSFKHSVEGLAKATEAMGASFSKIIDDLMAGNRYIVAWLVSELRRLVDNLIRPEIQALRRLIKRDFTLLYKRDWRLHQVAAAYARQQDRALHRVIELEAVSGYRAGYQGRVGVITKLIDYAAARAPLIKGIADRIITGVLDLASIDNPLARIFIGFLLKRVINALGVDKLAGAFTADLLAPLTGQAKPAGLHDVILDVSTRIGAVESQWAQFYANGGSEVEQAGDEWQSITSPIGDIAIVAFVAAAVVDPVTWARDVQNTIGRAAGDIVVAAADLFRGA